MKLNLIFLTIYLISYSTSFAQWEQYKVSNSDIPTDNILSLALDSKNNLWMSTDSGLVKFDGVNNWQHFNKQNSMNPSNYNAAIAVDKNDVVWSSSEGGDFAFS